MSRYPTEREADIALRDGSTARVRPVRANDGPAIRAFLAALSPDSIVFRFFGMPNLEWVISWSVDVDYSDRFALVAETGDPPRIVAHAAYVRGVGARAEVAFLVADELQGQGISTTLLAHLAAVAQRNGIETFTAEVMPSNHRMVQVFRDSGFPVEVQAGRDAISVELPTSLTPEAASRFDERERVAAVAAVRAVLEPRSVAVIGASRRFDKIGGAVLHNLLAAGFTGHVHAVNLAAESVQGLDAHVSVADIPEPVDLAVVAVPAEQVVAVARDCARARVRALVVIQLPGFAEAGADGADRQRELLEICRAAGIRIVGPNCPGVLNTAPEVRLQRDVRATPGAARLDRVHVLQSGGLGIAIIEAAGRLGLGLSSFVSVGNKADLSGNDMLLYWEQDPSTDVALLYLESFGNPRKFARIAPRFARRKPLLAVKSGRSTAGARASSSHTGALLSASDVTVDALFEQAGVIRTDTLYELFTVAQLLTAQPVPRGDRVAIVTNAGGPGIMCADACQADGVDVPELSPKLRRRLAGFLPGDASTQNPVDMLASATADEYRRTLAELIRDDACDAILAIFVSALGAAAEEIGDAIRSVAEGASDVAIAAVFMTAEPPPASLRSERAQVPGYEFPEDAARAVALAARHGRWRTRPEIAAQSLGREQPERAAAIISGQLAEAPGWMTPDRVSSLLATHGLSISGESAGPESDGGVVRLVVGVVTDVNFGPVLALAADGDTAELVKDVAVRITPLSEPDSRRDDPLAEDIPAAGRLPWPASGRPRGAPGRPAPGQRDGGGAPGDRRARPASAAGVRDRRGHPSRTRAGRERAAGGADAVAAGLSWVPPRMATVVARGDPSQSPPVSRVYRPLGRSEQPKRPERAFPGRGSGRKECWRAPTSRPIGCPGRFWTFWLPTAPDPGRE